MLSDAASGSGVRGYKCGRTSLPVAMRGGHRKLKWRGRDIALADPAADGLAWVPGLPERFSLPLGVGDDAFLLSGKPDVVDLAKPELARHLGKAIDADAIHRVVEINVAGLLDRLVQSDRAVALPAAEIVTAEEKTAGQVMRSSGVMTPASSPASAVTTLKVEPGDTGREARDSRADDRRSARAPSIAPDRP